MKALSINGGIKLTVNNLINQIKKEPKAVVMRSLIADTFKELNLYDNPLNEAIAAVEKIGLRQIHEMDMSKFRKPAIQSLWMEKKYIK